MWSDPPARAGRRALVVGYTAGVFDRLHVGHLQLLREARRHCDHLIVGVSSDELAAQAGGEPPLVPLADRMAVVGSIRFVDQVVPQRTADRLHAWATLRYDVLFAGDHLRGQACWAGTEAELAEVGARVEYLPAIHREPAAD